MEDRKQGHEILMNVFFNVSNKNDPQYYQSFTLEVYSFRQ